MNAVKALKNNKAPGIHAITEEMLKSAGDTAHEILHRIVKIIWQTRGTPPGDNWNKSHTKKGRHNNLPELQSYNTALHYL